jgi:hypothetical protein
MKTTAESIIIDFCRNTSLQTIRRNNTLLNNTYLLMKLFRHSYKYCFDILL